MTARFVHVAPWGAEIVDGGARFRLWAPARDKVSLLVENGTTVPMTKTEGDWFEVTTDAVPVGGGYRFLLAGGTRVPDPAARAQVADVHGPSRLVDPKDFEWRSTDWKGRPWEEAVLYELHTGTFSSDGTFDGIAADLDRLVDVGITAIELMPVAQFAGTRGWGYDGVLLYAPHAAYGGPDGLKRLVDEAHSRGLMVLLDVVYNHFGLDGNYLHLYAPDFFDAKRHTPWGAAIAFERAPVRSFFVHNVLYWLEEFRFDGLRLDAIDQIKDPSQEEILAEMAREVRARFPDRHIHLTIEDDENTTRLLQFEADNRPRLFTAKWNDDWHHAMHAALTCEDAGYYQDYADAPVRRVAEAMACGFSYQGEPSSFRGGRKRGEPSAHLPPTAFIDFLQNHDQTGNRAQGDRIATLVKPEAVEAALALLLLSPHIPLLYMGDEYGERRPFLFFTDFAGALAEAVRKGRNREFKGNKAFTDAFANKRVPDPNALETFTASKLAPETTSRTALVKRLIAARFAHIVPRLAEIGGDAGNIERITDTALTMRWTYPQGDALQLTGNLGDMPLAWPHPERSARFFTYPGDLDLSQGVLPPWSVIAAMIDQE
jgi:maltooligosyltrehalose trehalohydrolase